VRIPEIEKKEAEKAVELDRYRISITVSLPGWIPEAIKQELIQHIADELEDPVKNAMMDIWISKYEPRIDVIRIGQ
jgi:hypothetical protein